MSSILKALKKIEENSPPPESHSPLTQPIDTKQVLYPPKKNHRRRFLYIFLILLLTGTSVFFFIQRHMIFSKVWPIIPAKSTTADEASSSSSANVYRSKIPKSNEKFVQRPPSAVRQPQKPISKTTQKRAEKKFQASTKSGSRRRTGAQSPSPIPPRNQAAKGTTDSRTKKALKKTSVLPGIQAAKKSASPKTSRPVRPIAPVTRARQPAQNRSRPTYRPMESDELKLQALAWSNEADRRMAVINGRIVHEGDSVDGYQIFKIREEDIIVKKSGESWRLEFGLQQ